MNARERHTGERCYDVAPPDRLGMRYPFEMWFLSFHERRPSTPALKYRLRVLRSDRALEFSPNLPAWW